MTKPIGEITNLEHDDGTNAKKVKIVGGDIEIGAVEIKDESTEERAAVSDKSLHIYKMNEVIGKVLIYLNNSTTITIYNPSYSYAYDSNGNMTEIDLVGNDGSGNSHTFKKTMTYDSNGNITNVSSWSEA